MYVKNTTEFGEHFCARVTLSANTKFVKKERKLNDNEIQQNKGLYYVIMFM